MADCSHCEKFSSCRTGASGRWRWPGAVGGGGTGRRYDSRCRSCRGGEEGGAAGPIDIRRAASGPGVTPLPGPGERLGLRLFSAFRVDSFRECSKNRE
ncbi:hypothetical protein GRJ2_000239100 [Grus japonensis]|uniref:Uncharacterized protein n=1 Tax=Grus japonensis TaxID=30415 RepID=A0ABC9VX17_GRUJA